MEHCSGHGDLKSSAVQSLKPADGSAFSFKAFNRQFRARLERDDLLLRGLSSEARSSLAGIDVFRGELVAYRIPGCD